MRRPSGRLFVQIQAKMSYYFYENWTAENKAKIHRAECGFCNYGKGIHPNASIRNGQWHGPFAWFDKAKVAAQQTGRPVSTCSFCQPS